MYQTEYHGAIPNFVQCNYFSIFIRILLSFNDILHRLPKLCEIKILKSSFKSRELIQKKKVGHSSKFRLFKPHQ